MNNKWHVLNVSHYAIVLNGWTWPYMYTISIFVKIALKHLFPRSVLSGLLATHPQFAVLCCAHMSDQGARGTFPLKTGKVKVNGMAEVDSTAELQHQQPLAWVEMPVHETHKLMNS